MAKGPFGHAAVVCSVAVPYGRFSSTCPGSRGIGTCGLIDFFTHVDEELTRQAAASPHVWSSDQDLRNLLAKRAGTLHLGTANYCCFADPGKAQCLTLVGTPIATKPLESDTHGPS